MTEENNIPLPEEGEPKTGDKIKKDWNLYLQYIDKMGYKGKDDLDKGGLGYKLFDEYVANNPSTSLNRDILPIIRKELLNYRTQVLESTKKGKGLLMKGVDEKNFMAHVVENEKTKIPDYPGKNLTITKFPDDYTFSYDADNKLKKVDKKFAYAPQSQSIAITQK